MSRVSRMSFLLLAVFLCGCFPAAAGSFLSRPLYLDNLNNTSVYSLHQDSSGYMWLNTGYGLYRFNGLKSEQFHSAFPMRPIVSGPGSDIFYCQDLDSIIRYDARGCLSKTLKTGDVDIRHACLTLCNDTLFVSDHRDLYRAEDDSLVLHIRIPNRMGTFCCIKGLTSGKIIASTSKGTILLIDGKTVLPKCELGDFACNIFEDSKGKIWVGLSESGVVRFDSSFIKEKNWVPSRTDMPGHAARKFRTFCETEDSVVFAGSLDGLYSIYPDGKCLPENSYTPEGYAICSLFSDKDKNIWIGTYYGSVFLCERNVSPFCSPDIEGIGQIRLASGIVEDRDSNIWIATDNHGLFRIDENHGFVTQIQSTKGSKLKYAWYDAASHSIWATEYLNALRQYDIAAEKWTDYPVCDSMGRKIKSSLFSIEEIDGEFWISGSNRIYLFDRKKENIISRYVGNFNKSAYSIKKDPDNGAVWIGSEGLYIMKDGVIRAIPSFDGIICYDIVLDGPQVLIATSDGAKICDHEGNILREYDKENIALPENLIYRIRPLPDGYLLLGTNCGISIVDMKSSNCYNYSSRNGLSLSSVQEGGIIMRSDGVLWIAGTDGVVTIDTKIPLSLPSTRKNIHLDVVSVNGQSLHPEKGEKTLTLKYEENNLSFRFASFDFVGIVPSVYECRMPKLEKEWREFDISAPVQYFGLHPGRYTFQYRVRENQLQGDSLSEGELKLLIRHAWWWSPVAWAIYILLLAFICRWQIILISEYRARKRSRDSKDVASVARNDREAMLMRSAVEYIEGRISDVDLCTDDLCEALNMSYTLLNSKLKEITGYSPRDFIEFIRMRKAAAMLADNNLNISEIAFSVGYNSSQYFTTRFKKQFGQTPSEYRSSGEQSLKHDF